MSVMALVYYVIITICGFGFMALVACRLKLRPEKGNNFSSKIRIAACVIVFFTGLLAALYGMVGVNVVISNGGAVEQSQVTVTKIDVAENGSVSLESDWAKIPCDSVALCRSARPGDIVHYNSKGQLSYNVFNGLAKFQNK